MSAWDMADADVRLPLGSVVFLCAPEMGLFVGGCHSLAAEPKTAVSLPHDGAPEFVRISGAGSSKDDSPFTVYVLEVSDY